MKVRARPLKDFSCLRASKCVTCLSRGNVRKKTHIAFIFTYAQASSLLIKFVRPSSGTLFYPPPPPSLSLSLSLPHFSPPHHAHRVPQNPSLQRKVTFQPRPSPSPPVPPPYAGAGSAGSRAAWTSSRPRATTACATASPSTPPPSGPWPRSCAGPSSRPTSSS